MNTLSYKTKSAKKEEVEHKWLIADADGESVGRLASGIAAVLRGKHKPSFTPHVDCGDYVIVLNASKIRFSGDKWNSKMYESYSGYPGGRKERKAKDVLEKHPEKIIESAVKGMLPKSKLGRQMFRKLFVYAEAEHPHAAQKPEPYKFV